VAVALLIACAAATLHFFRANLNDGWSDFTPLWQAARLMLTGDDPYLLIGPGKPFHSPYPMYYPATTFVSIAPFAVIPSFQWAGTAFVFVSSFLLAYGCTANGWQMLPIFPSVAFLTSATLAQWSIVFTAMVFIPALGFLAVAKPQSALPVVLSSERRLAFITAVAGGLMIFLVSVVLMPEWPREWWAMARSSPDFVPPLLRFAGFAIPLVLLRWRRPESWLVLLSACVPQTWPPYNGLVLMTVARTYREASFLSLFSSASWILFAWFADGLGEAHERSMMAAVLNIGGYLPATLLILRRPNTGAGPFPLAWILSRRRSP
jgi:hypothetical protein